MSGAGKGSAVVIGASGGIGGAFEAALIEEGAFDAVYGFARSRGGAQHLDLTDEASIAAAAAIVGKGAPPTLVIVATGLLHAGGHGPEKALRELDPAWLAQVYAVNAIGPALVAKHFLPIMPKAARTVFAALSARVGSISDNQLGGWHGYRASKAALNMLVRNPLSRNAAAMPARLSSRCTPVRSTPRCPARFKARFSPGGCSTPNGPRCNCSM